MATSTNYGWAEPDNSSLVKNGASDMRTLGNAIDASVWNIGKGQAGKNKIINGDFNINQRSFSSTTTNNAYGFDRFKLTYSGGTTTMSAQTFTAGTAPVAGYEAKNFLRLVSASQSAAGDYAAHRQSIEDVRTFAGQTVTVSLWAKASTGTPNLGITLAQNFGTGGSSTVPTSAAVQAITSSWARYSFTIAVPSIAGKTISTSNDHSLDTWVFISAGSTLSSAGYAATGIQNVTIDTWGVQVEAGSTATPFQTASGGSPQAELAMCQRYYYLHASGLNQPISNGNNNSATLMRSVIPFPVTMRTTPSLVASSGTNYYQYQCAAAADLFNSLTLGDVGQNCMSVFNNTEISGVAGQGGLLLINNAAASVAFSAEL